ncbi:3222_t:CDS:2, partial [Entrophospora sp. SA101]
AIPKLSVKDFKLVSKSTTTSVGKNSNITDKLFTPDELDNSRNY